MNTQVKKTITKSNITLALVLKDFQYFNNLSLINKKWRHFSCWL